MYNFKIVSGTCKFFSEKTLAVVVPSKQLASINLLFAYDLRDGTNLDTSGLQNFLLQYKYI